MSCITFKKLQREKTYPGLTGSRLFRELKVRELSCWVFRTDGFASRGETLLQVRGFEVRVESLPGEQGQMDFA